MDNNNKTQPASANDGTPKGLPPKPTNAIVNQFPSAPAMKQTRNTGENSKGTQFLRNHLSNPND